MSYHISVNDIAAAREIRVDKIKTLLEKQGTESALLVTLNIPGDIKDIPLYRKIHKTAIAEIIKSFKWNRIEFLLEERFDIPTGSEGYVTVNSSNPSFIKKITSEIEENHPLGRLFDIDIFKKPYEKVSSGRPLRKCFICGNDAFACSRSKAHPIPLLLDTINMKAENYFKDYYSWRIAETACRALITEAAAAPKPGLVDRYNNGAHTDMDFFSFINSSAALFRTFHNFAGISYSASLSGLSLPDMLAALQKEGIEGEKNMLRASGGINTQKGLIFSLGLLVSAAAYLSAHHGEKTTASEICSAGRSIISDNVKKHLSAISEQEKITKQDLTAGEKLFLSHGIKGARGEAAGGFKSAMLGHKVLSADIAAGKDFNLSLIDALMNIMEKTDDTNIPGRKDMNALDYIKSEASEYNRTGGVFCDSDLAVIRQMDIDFTDRNLSPGGCADILALSIFLFFIENELESFN